MLTGELASPAEWSIVLVLSTKPNESSSFFTEETELLEGFSFDDDDDDWLPNWENILSLSSFCQLFSSSYDTNLRHLQRDAKLITDLWPIR